MTRNRRAVVLACTLLSAAALFLEAERFADAREDRAARETAFDLLRREAETVQRGRAMKETVALKETPASDLIAAVNGALTKAGVPTRIFEGLAPEGTARAVEGERELKRQVMRGRFHAVSDADLGRFFAVWRDSEPLWSVTALELTPLQGPDARGTFDVALSWSSLLRANS